MATAAAVAASSSSLLFRVLPAASSNNSNGRIQSTSHLFLGTSRTSPFLHPLLPSRSVLAFSRSKRNNAPTPTSSKTKKSLQDDYGEEDDLDGDALEALFSQLEEDLKNDGLSTNDNDDEISEEDMARLEQELEEAFGDGSEDELAGTTHSNMENIDGYDDDSDDDEEEERPLNLRTWQLRRLAAALKIGRRKTSIKNLAGELGLDRAVVLELLREPPPDLLLMCASLPDLQRPPEPKSKPFESSPVVTAESKPLEASPETMTESKHVEPSIVNVAKPKNTVKEPIHVVRKRWFMQKRLKKVHLETLEKVYSRTKRPTNAMISSIVHVTRLPWKRVVKWFEDKRQEEGIPEERLPYRRSMPETVSTD
ncbi:hypothetical protein MRB53_006230 [Persea americana]|uniref:Uncharacterized protein n=1 Tax=Persea americana TaxID=3435 RepID=A0ACC2MFJ4_PERAE|nr:hypothetical protein MRB53_006230 [Persea americana]